ncbi:hypothetical protein HMPREF9086_3199 [Enterobacter hormaechei ATCC 49162]|nr:hypothetical protein HMPREF9086_3199 [Enterobacter hormaechei ATCC 49162]
MPELTVIKGIAGLFMLKISYNDEYYSGVNKKTILTEGFVPLSNHS